jgi:predicted nuclease of predicted toxin-antitoxin system
MRLLADENFPKPIVDVLRAGGHDVLWARTDCRGWRDSALLEFAESEARIMLTLDKDFWQIAVQRRILSNDPGWSCSGCIPRLPGISNRSSARS